MSSSSPPADRNLIFGLIALQMDFVSREQLLDAMHAWMLAKQIPLGEVLCRRGVLAEDERQVLDLALQKHLRRHGGDAQASLAALRVEESVRHDLHRLGDADVQASIASLATTPPHGPAGRIRHGTAENSVTWPATSAPAAAAAGGGRFRRLREHARGGLGEVFVALDAELHREVALKEIQDRFADLDEARTRFVREAEITGNLEHPGVVPVYGLGAHLDGRPYYAMRLIRGESMQHAVTRYHQADEDPRRDRGERSLALRDLLGRFVAMCHAVAYAHARGVIHRDLKPANVMLGEYGETLVVDWGVARVLEPSNSEQTSAERPLSASSGNGTATEMGQVVGTPAFMPPEQAEGWLDRVGVASDVFSLGATLYAVLTGQPPYQGDDVLEQGRRADVVPARQRKRSVPAALEAVCGKAMAKRPEDRYPTARALAEEVQRWLADEPVQAYPEPLADRLRRWGRRNRSVVSAGVVLLVAVVIGLSVGLWAVQREQERTKEAARLAREQTQRAERAERDKLEHYRASTDDAIEQLIGSKQVLGLQEKSYLEKTLQRWLAFAEQTGDDEQSRAIRAEGHFRVALLRNALGQTEEALAGYREALAIRQRLADEFPAVPEYRKDLAASHNNLGTLLAGKNQWAKAAEQYHEALTIFQKLAGAFPAVPAYRHNLAATHNNLGKLLASQNQGQKAVAHYHEAIAIQQKLADDFPAVPDYRQYLARTQNNLAFLLKNQNERDKAIEQYHKALAIQETLAGDFPRIPEYRKDLAGFHNNLGVLLLELNQLGKATEQYHKALSAQQPLVAEFPTVPAYRRELAATHHNLGLLLAAQKQGEKAAQQYHKALKIRQKLADDFPTVPSYRKDVAQTHINLGALLLDQKQQKAAAEHYRQALAIQQQLADEFATDPEYRNELAGTHNNLGLLLAARNQDKAAEHYRKALAIRQKLVDDFPTVPAYQVHLAGTYGNYGRLLRDGGKPADSLEWFDRAIRMLSRVHRQDPRVVIPRKFLRNSHAGRASAYDQLNKLAEAIEDWTRAVELSPLQEQPSLRVHRVNSRVRAGQIAEAVTEVAELTKAGNWPANQWYDFACIYAVASDKTADKKQEYADRAIELLRVAVQAGYNDAAHMAKDGDLDVLRQRDDFKKLLASLAKAKEKGPAGVPEKK